MTIFVQITGRLGNNLFQIALGYSLSQKTNQNFAMVYNSHNIYEQEWIHYFPEITFIPRQKVPCCVIFSEKNNGVNCFEFHPEVLELCKTEDILFDGYFQNHKYFTEYLPDLKKMFLKNEINNNQINNSTDGYFIHVRRGDYVNHPVYQIDYPEYFKKAIKHFPKDSKFYILSDDLQFCETWDLFDTGSFSFVDLDTIASLHFMASCKGGICANSSFSWWGAFLGRREIVTMPLQWINNGMDTSDLPFPGVIKI
jgi:hypothetical protein